MIRTDKLYINGGYVGINSADGALHTAADTGEPIGKKKKQDDHYIDPKTAAVCLNCEKENCTGDERCFKLEQQKRNGSPAADPACEAFIREYHKMRSSGVKHIRIAEMLGMHKGTLWWGVRNGQFGGESLKRIKRFLKKRGIEYGK